MWYPQGVLEALHHPHKQDLFNLSDITLPLASIRDIMSDHSRTRTPLPNLDISDIIANIVPHTDTQTAARCMCVSRSWHQLFGSQLYRRLTLDVCDPGLALRLQVPKPKPSRTPPSRLDQTPHPHVSIVKDAAFSPSYADFVHFLAIDGYFCCPRLGYSPGSKGCRYQCSGLDSDWSALHTLRIDLYGSDDPLFTRRDAGASVCGLLDSLGRQPRVNHIILRMPLARRGPPICERDYRALLRGCRTCTLVFRTTSPRGIDGRFLDTITSILASSTIQVLRVVLQPSGPTRWEIRQEVWAELLTAVAKGIPTTVSIHSYLLEESALTLDRDLALPWRAPAVLQPSEPPRIQLFLQEMAEKLPREVAGRIGLHDLSSFLSVGELWELGMLAEGEVDPASLPRSHLSWHGINKYLS